MARALMLRKLDLAGATKAQCFTKLPWAYSTRWFSSRMGLGIRHSHTAVVLVIYVSTIIKPIHVYCTLYYAILRCCIQIYIFFFSFHVVFKRALLLRLRYAFSCTAREKKNEMFSF
ncbi:hypothetical protein OPV43_044 [Saccharomyces cerevisiae synthetic construct]|uniref:Putative uncharacterized protein YCL023C n=1 Tax=Saccharomyces cerevisiae (strain ATCC 204508 / S288c) TaxID=559292 RepID=YCC3_YEAST|nr:RecName: Full=Putative uncharacterized protein YCL023C [Saccharomyces cerevisiae S288C]AHV79243.1 hypothetical protein [synthetic construct]UZT75798.1 hypothetical protein OPV43_044 [Saccharomyces cerevisiae synthetic construct]WNV71660.1 hypothetical protein O6U65_0493 [Saccharomyces cerevisiae synthetic construct]CAA42362.1 hypothetical protein [Saccharomyces cerevisiae]